MKIDVDRTTFEFMLVALVRYSLGRRTYSSGIALDAVRSLAPKASKSTQEVLLRDIDEHGGRDVLRDEAYGDRCDRSAWAECRRILVNLLERKR